MKKLEADIKNGLKRKIYLLYGPEAYLRNRYRDSLVKFMLPTSDAANLARFEGKDIDVSEVIDLAQTMPFFSEKRVIVLENTEFFAAGGAASEVNDFADCIETLPESTCIIISQEKADSRLKLFKKIKQYGCVAEFAALGEEQVKKFILDRLSKEHRPITGRALDKFMEGCGNDFMQICAELDKLISYTFGKDGIRPEDVEAVCSQRVEDEVFLMLDAMFRHNTDEALGYYKDLVTLNHNPFATLSLIENQLRLFLHVRQMDSEHLSTKEMAGELSMNEFRIKKALPYARKSSKIQILRALEKCAGIDEAAKSGGVNPQIGLEMIICELCTGDL